MADQFISPWFAYCETCGTLTRAHSVLQYGNKKRSLFKCKVCGMEWEERSKASVV